MSTRLLSALLVVQTALLAVLIADRIVPPAHAADGMRCEIANWPDALTGTGFASVRVVLEETKRPVPIEVKRWATSDVVGVAMKDWDTYDKVKVEVQD